jgi:hypothetical protein
MHKIYHKYMQTKHEGTVRMEKNYPPSDVLNFLFDKGFCYFSPTVNHRKIILF